MAARPLNSSRSGVSGPKASSFLMPCRRSNRGSLFLEAGSQGASHRGQAKLGSTHSRVLIAAAPSASAGRLKRQPTEQTRQPELQPHK